MAERIKKRSYRTDVKERLTDARRIAISNEIAKAHGKLGEVESAKRESASHYKSEADKLNREIGDRTTILREGFEWLPADVDELHDYDAHKVEIIRTDTGEVIEERAMKPAELQRTFLPDVEA